VRTAEPAQRLILAAIAAALCALQLYAFHWGVITPDTVVQYGQALTGHYDDWHPPVTAWLWRQLLHLHHGSAPFLLFDVLLYWTGIASIALILQRRAGMPAAAAIIGFASLPIGFGEIGSILKDSLLACLLVMATALILRREDRPRCWWLAVLALPLIVVASATRFNAVFAATPLIVMLLPAHWVRRPARMLIAGIGAAALLAFTGWLINDAMLAPTKSRPIFSLVNFDLAGIAAHGGGNPYPLLGYAEAARLTAYCYSPRLYGQVDDDGCAPAEDSLVDYADRHHRGAIAIWLKAVTAAPLPYAAHRLAHLNWNWRFLIADIPNDAVYIMSEPNDLGLRFIPNPVTRAVGVAARWMAWSPFGRPISWLAIAIGLLVVAPGLPSRRFVTAMAVSALLYGGGYAAISVSCDLRYNLWTMLAVMIGLAVAFADWRAGAARPGKARALWAAAPFMLVAVLEMVAFGIGAR
jgi:hypothetical protein